MATYSNVLAWRIPGTGEPGGLPSMGSQSRTRLKQQQHDIPLSFFFIISKLCGLCFQVVTKLKKFFKHIC